MELLAYAGVVFLATLAAITFYAWLKAEWDERQWRKIIQEELEMPRLTYRMVRDIEDKGGSDRG
jgi:hypothetical protein